MNPLPPKSNYFTDYIGFIVVAVLMALAMTACYFATGSIVDPVIPEDIEGDDRDQKLFILRIAFFLFCIAIIILIRSIILWLRSSKR